MPKYTCLKNCLSHQYNNNKKQKNEFYILDRFWKIAFVKMSNSFDEYNQSGKFGVSGSENQSTLTEEAVLLQLKWKVLKSIHLKNTYLFWLQKIAQLTIRELSYCTYLLGMRKLPKSKCLTRFI